MNLITLEHISKSYSEKNLLKDVSLGINEGDKVGLIGVNGAGKSTFLKIVAGFDEFFQGTVVKGKKILKEYEDLVEKISLGKNEELNERLLKLQQEIDDLNLWALESEAKSILNKLGIKNYDEKIKNLSGGQKKRVALASALISPCELLILDEPTNHLDSESIEWLEEYLNSRKGALLMITHDRYFLDRVTNKILELDRGVMYSYEGNYTSFLEKKMERLQLEQALEDKRQSLIRNELKWVRRGAKARTTKQKARLQRFDELVNREYVKPQENLEMSFIGTRLGKKIIEIDNISKAFGDKTLIKDFSYIFTKTDRIGVVGENGAGKTTLINILRGKLMPDSGSIEVGETVKIGCFAQDNTSMDPNVKAIDYIKEGGEVIPVADGSKITASTLCERFLFDGTLQYSKIEKLSGGERRRLHLLRVLMESPNVLLLDEPTNDLDINTLTILEDFLDSFLGVVLVVSHDRYFLDRICNKIFSYEGNGLIKPYYGNFSDYQISKVVEEVEKDEKKKEKKPEVKRVKNKDTRPKFSFKEAKEYETIEEDISKLEEKISELEEEMVKNSSSYGKLQELIEEKEKTEEELLYKYERYEYLENLAKKIEEYKKNK